MKATIPKEKIYRSFIYIGVTAVIIFLANFIVTREGLFSAKAIYEQGQIADKTIVAPYDFYLYEEEGALKQKQDKALADIVPHYKFSSGASFQAMKKLNQIFEILENSPEKQAPDAEILSKFNAADFNISRKQLNFFKNKNVRTKIYKTLMHNLEKIMQKGISTKPIQSDKIILLKEGKKVETLSKQIMTPQESGAYLLELTQGKDIFGDKRLQDITLKLLYAVVEDNVEFDAESTSRAKELAKSSIPKIVGEVLKNELIVQKHQKVTKEVHKKLQALQRKKEELSVEADKNENLFPAVGQFFYILFILVLFIPVFYLLDRKILQTASLLRCVLILTLLNAVLGITLQNVGFLSVFLLPFAMSIILISFLIGSISAFAFGIVNFLLLLTLINWQFAFGFVISFSGLYTIIALNYPRSRRNFYVASFYNLIFFIFFLFLMGALHGWPFIKILSNLQWGFASVLVSLLGSMVLLSPFEQRLPVVTNIHLQEIGDFNNPLLETLSEVAPGTFHHSVIVGNLAEAAAKAIQANPILSRVGSYYHDVGKTKHPEYFIENSSEEENVHNELSSTESAQRIKQHVKDGVKLTQENNLPQIIADILQQHHGTSQISYFYQQAKNDNEQIDDNDFYYDGPKPQTKEAAIVMIADIVESTAKSLESPNREQIEEVVRNTIAHLIRTDQLSECGISLQELKAVQASMIPILFGIYRKRVAYPK